MLHNNSCLAIFTIPALERAWKKIEQKKSAPGIDGVTVSTFSHNVPDQLSQLRQEIISSQFHPKPLISFVKEKADATLRELTIPTIRYKIIARTISEYFNENYDPQLLPQSYAYRPGKGAVKAAAVVEHQCQHSHYTHICRLDIQAFFDTIPHQKLKHTLHELGLADDTLNLVGTMVTAPHFDGVETHRPIAGIPQGSPLAPILSNLYMHQFDQSLATEHIPFVRYADDIVLFAPNATTAQQHYNYAIDKLADLGLKINPTKSKIYTIQQGFIFLGFHFDQDGKMPCKEAQKRLDDKLTTPKYADETQTQYQTRLQSITRGWNNYFHDTTHLTEPHTLTTVQKQPDSLPVDQPVSPSIPAHTPIPITQELKFIDILAQTQRHQEALTRLRRILTNHDTQISTSTHQTYTRLLAHLYQSLGLRGAAIRCLKSIGEDTEILVARTKESFPFGPHDIESWIELLGSGAGHLSRQYVDKLGRHGYRSTNLTLTPEVLRDHWANRHTLAVPIYTPNNHVKFGVIDLDISRKILDTETTEKIEELKQNLLLDARHLLDIAHEQHVEGILEDSGYKGYHIWFFFHHHLPAAMVRKFLTRLCEQGGESPSGTHRETFPISDQKPEAEIGQRIKLPLGIHRLSGHHSTFLSPAGEICPGGIQLLSRHVYRTKASVLKNAIKNWSHHSKEPSAHPMQPNPTKNSRPESPSTNTISHSTDIASPVAQLLETCSVLKALAQRAKNQQHLNHYERIVLRGILAPLGPNGIAQIHTILKHCRNYSKKVTDKMTATTGYKPMGCRKIREILDYICKDLPCNCRFTKRKNDYDHPLRHLTAHQKGRPTHDLLQQIEHIHNPQPQNTPTEPQTLVELVQEYRQQRTKILQLQQKMIEEMDGADAQELGIGLLRCDGKDPDLRHWRVSFE